MNQLQPFAHPSPPGVARQADRCASSPRLSATFDHEQMLTHGAGRGSPSKLGKLSFHASTPTRVFRMRGQASVLRDGVSSLTCRGLRPPAFSITRHRANGCCVQFQAVDHALRNAVDPLPSQFETSVFRRHHHAATEFPGARKAFPEA